MCRYTYHHYTRCGHISSFAIHSCVEFLNLLRGLSQPGSNSPELSCTNIKVEHDLCSTNVEAYCLQCELDWLGQVSTNGTEETVHSIPDYVPIEGLDSEAPLITTRMQWQWPTMKSRKREFHDAFLDLDLDGDRKSDSSNGTVKPSSVDNASAMSSPEVWHEFVDVPFNAHVYDAEDEEEEDDGPSPAKKRNDSGPKDYVVIGTDKLNTQAERLSSPAKDDEDEEEFYSMWLSDSDSDSDSDDGDAGSIMRQLKRFTFPTYRSAFRPPDSPPCSPRTRPRPNPLPPLYVGFPGQPPERSPRTRRPSSRGNYLDARTELQSPVFDGFPGIFPDEDELTIFLDEDELGLRSPGLVSFPRIVIEDVDGENEEEEKKVEAGRSTGSVLGLRGASLASDAVLKGLNIVLPRE